MTAGEHRPRPVTALPAPLAITAAPDPPDRMRNRLRKTSIALALVALAACAAVAAPAGANRSQVTIIQHDGDLLYGPAELRNARLDEFRDLGVEVVKFRMDWRAMAPAPDSNTKPSGFSGENPDEYPSQAWAAYDEVIKGIVSRGMRPYAMLGGRAPEWATDGSGFVTRPSGAEFKRFAQAVGTRYSGTFGGYTDPLAPGGGAAGLPRVTLWGLWNEPNLKSWLSPQWKRSTPVSPRYYRELVYGGQDGLAASGHGGDDILIGELQPFTGPRRSSSKVRPVEFLRELACLDRRYRAYRGSAARSRGCTSFRRLPGAGLAYHPYTLAGGPTVRQRHRDDASIGQISRIVTALDRLAARGRMERGKLPVWNSEFAFQTNPPDTFQSPIKRVPGFMAESEWIGYRNGRVASYAQYLIRDDPLGPRNGGFQSGLRFDDGRPKPGVYSGFQLPFFVRLRSSNQVEVFGGVRAGAAGQQVTLEQRRGGGSFGALRTITLGTNGYFLTKVNISRASSREFRFRAGDSTSRRTKAVRR
jgi:hypothetical protein